MIHRIPITQKHIDDGVQGDCEHCAIKLALNDGLPGAGIHWNMYCSGYHFLYNSHTFAASNGIDAYITNYDIEKHYADPRTLILDDEDLVAYMEGEF